MGAAVVLRIDQHCDLLVGGFSWEHHDSILTPPHHGRNHLRNGFCKNFPFDQHYSLHDVVGGLGQQDVLYSCVGR